MEFINDWKDLGLVCTECGSSKNVKFRGNDGVAYCTKCVKDKLSHKTRFKIRCSNCNREIDTSYEEVYELKGKTLDFDCLAECYDLNEDRVQIGLEVH